MKAESTTGLHIVIRLFACIAALGLTAFFPAAAAAITIVPDNIVCENRDGRQLIVKTYTLQPEEDPAMLAEEPFEQEGFLYTLISIVKDETPFESRKTQSETVTVETVSDDLSVILDALTPTLSYNDGGYSGVLALDHTSLRTEATGYSTKSYTVSETKTIGSLDRNDPSYVPKTTVKNGRTLTLSNIEWSVQGTSLADDVLVPTQFMAVATYRGSASQKVADGYITTAVYSGEIISAGIASITYTVTYFGETVIAASQPRPVLRYFLPAAAVLLLIALLLGWLFTYKNAKIYAFAENGLEYELLGKQKLNGQNPYINLCGLARYPEPEAVIEIKRHTARRLFGRAVRVRLRDDIKTHLIEHTGSGNYWFSVPTMEEVTE